LLCHRATKSTEIMRGVAIESEAYGELEGAEANK
jgi:hypothetical protein